MLDSVRLVLTLCRHCMSGANCAIFGCTVSRNHVGVSIFRIPTKDDEYSINWRQKLLNIQYWTKHLQPTSSNAKKS